MSEESVEDFWRGTAAYNARATGTRALKPAWPGGGLRPSWTAGLRRMAESLPRP